MFGCGPVLPHFCRQAAAMLLTGSCSCEDWHSCLRLWEPLKVWVGFGREGCSPVLGFELPWDRHPFVTTLSRSFEVLPLQEDLRQHFLHFLQVGHKTIE